MIERANVIKLKDASFYLGALRSGNVIRLNCNVLQKSSAVDQKVTAQSPTRQVSLNDCVDLEG